MILSLQYSPVLRIRLNNGRCDPYPKPVVHAALQNLESRSSIHFLSSNFVNSSELVFSQSSNHTNRKWKQVCGSRSRNHQFRCHCFLNRGISLEADFVKNATLTLARLYKNYFQGHILETKLASAVGIIIFAVWGLVPLARLGRKMLLHKSDGSWKRSNTYHLTTSYIQPLLVWTGAILICRSLDPVTLPTEAAQLVKRRLLTFFRSLSTVLAFAYCLSSVIQQAQKFFVETNDPADTRNVGFQFAGKAIYTALWVAAASLFMELLGFSTQKWLTAGGLGTVLLTLAGREIFTNFLSSAMIHATRPFVLNEWIQTKIEGYDVSGTVERVGWWSPTIVRGEDREAVHIPNHKFTVNVVRNLSQKTHWRIKTHLCISHLDVSKINSIVADMRKVLAKNPQVEQQKLHRRVFLENIDPENQALMILVSCFVKTSHVEEYLCVKESILLDLLRVIRHHRARLATPIRTFQRVYAEPDVENVPFSDSIFTNGTTSNRPLLLVETSLKNNGAGKTKSQATAAEDDSKAAAMSTPDVKAETQDDGTSGNAVIPQTQEDGTKDDRTPAATSASDPDVRDIGKPLPKAELSTDEEKKQRQEEGLETIPVSQPPLEAPRTDSSSHPPPSNKSSLEENIVLGVALDGSKRTLPIEEAATDTSSNTEDAKEAPVLRSEALQL